MDEPLVLAAPLPEVVLLGLVVAGLVPLVEAPLDDDCALGCAAAAPELAACL
ncbi:MAG: hypothetical protein ACYCXG_07790 [Acidiferrobacter sp.]